MKRSEPCARITVRCRENVVRGLDPLEDLRAGVVLIEERIDDRLQFRDAAMDASPDLALREHAEEALHLIEVVREIRTGG